MLAATRKFFVNRGVLEVDTPVLSAAAVCDPNIDSIRAELDLLPGAPRFLRTSPEFHMKRLLCAGFPDIFEIARVFRDAESGPRHLPEFTLVEWYRLAVGFDDIMQETVDLLSSLIEPRLLPRPATFISYREAFERFAGVDPLTASLAALRRAGDVDERLAEALGDRRDEWLDLLLMTHVAPRFDSDRLTVLHRYPASQAALARLDPHDADLAQRFELFFGDLELANGFVELTDPAEQAARFARDQDSRLAAGKPLRPLDRRFLSALEAGLPSCAGVAAGFDRILMINEGSRDIRNVVTFSFEDA
jgi:lysyl-tRNA synthetase class 2